MEQVKAFDLLIRLKGLLPSDMIEPLSRELEKLPPEKLEKLLLLDLHDPIFITLLSVFLGSFGIDRIVLGDIAYGISKFLFGWATLGIWPLFDVYFSYQRAKKKNLDMIVRAMDINLENQYLRQAKKYLKKT